MQWIEILEKRESMRDYDSSSPISIFDFSKGLLNKTLYEVVREMNSPIAEGALKIKGKGSLGQLVEKFYYRYDINNNPEADFLEAGVELKTTPLKKNKEGDLIIKERLVCDMIDFCSIVNVRFEDSAFYKKSLLMLILFYLHQKGVEKYNLKFLYSVLWKLQDKDLQIIRQDYEIIVDKIKKGKAHELSEGDTMYLGACRKGQKGDPLRRQPFSDKGAPKRAFALKTAYMRTVLDYVKRSDGNMVTNTQGYLPSTQLVTIDELKKKSFDEIITERLLAFKGKDYKQIAKAFSEHISPKEKSKYDHATRIILHKGLTRFENAEEIKKAGIIVKNIRIQKNGLIKESMSFKNLNYSEIYETESFYDSEWYELITSKFLFVIYRETDIPQLQCDLWQGESRYVLDRVLFWTMPESDMQVAEEYWMNIRENVLADKHYIEPDNTYWKILDHKNFHVRPKGRDALDLQTSPVSGKCVRKTCYWFNSEYVREILRRDEEMN